MFFKSKQAMHRRSLGYRELSMKDILPSVSQNLPGKQVDFRLR